MSNEPTKLREIAVSIAADAARLARSRREQVFGDSAFRNASDAVSTKSTATDPVTVVDTETEQFIRDRLAQVRPDDAILGEEFGGVAGSPETDGAVRWVVDPIDGTVNFLYGIPAYAVSIAAQIGGESVAGAVVDVATGTVYAAARGHGATETDAGGAPRALRANPLTDPSLALVATGFSYSAPRRSRQGEILSRVLPQVRDVRRIGSAALDLCMVAAGRVDAHYEHGLSPWDWAAGALIAQEAGAKIIVPSPTSTSAAGALTLAAAPGLATEFTEILRRAGGLDQL